jgi:ABC-type sulfate transport system permease subunit
MDYTTTSTASSSEPLQNLIGLAVLVLLVASLWKIFTKAGKPGWAAIVPFYNAIVLLQIVGRPVWWFVMLFVPFVNVIFAIIVAHDTSKSFGKGVGTTLLLILLPFIGYPMLAWGDAEYVVPSAGGSSPAAA